MKKIFILFKFSCLLLAGCYSNASFSCLTKEQSNNNDISQAEGPLCSGETISGNISRRSDNDYFYFDAVSGSANISLTHHSRDDFDWILYDANGYFVTSSESSQIPEERSIELADDGRYYLNIVRYRGTGYYDLIVTFSESSGGGSDPAGCGYGLRPEKPSGLVSYLSVATGQSDTDQCLILTQAAVLLMGGNFDVDDAFSNRVAPLVSGGDVVVLRTSGSDGYNDVLLQRISANSVETLLVDTRAKANSDYVAWAIRSAEFVFVAGGDQADYLNQWKGTEVESALNHVIEKGGIIGGTSAGNAIQGEYVYDPDGLYGIYSEEAVSDACHEYLNLSTFLTTPFMQNLVTDTHFAQRDRMGRLAVFMGMTNQPVTGIGVDEDTSIFIRADGSSIVDGDFSVYVLQYDANSERAQFECGAPVIYNAIRRYKLNAGDTFNFTTNQSSVNFEYLSIDGRQASFYSPSNPY